MMRPSPRPAGLHADHLALDDGRGGLDEVRRAHGHEGRGLHRRRGPGKGQRQRRQDGGPRRPSAHTRTSFIRAEGPLHGDTLHARFTSGRPRAREDFRGASRSRLAGRVKWVINIQNTSGLSRYFRERTMSHRGTKVGDHPRGRHQAAAASASRARRLVPRSASVAAKISDPIAPPKRSKTPKKPNISSALCCGIMVANSERARLRRALHDDQVARIDPRDVTSRSSPVPSRRRFPSQSSVAACLRLGCPDLPARKRDEIKYLEGTDPTRAQKTG